MSIRAESPVSLQYENYLALLAYIKDDESGETEPRSNTGGDSEQDGIEKLATNAVNRQMAACNKFLQRSSHYLNKVRRHAHSAGVSTDFDLWLYNPACWMGFGRTDQIGLVLLDDFDPIFEITSELDVTIERIAVAFCPKLSSLGFEESQLAYFRPLHGLLADGVNHRAQDIEKSVGELQPDEFVSQLSYEPHGFERQAPLVAVSRFKLGVLASLGQGLLVQRAVLRAIVCRTSRVIEELKESPHGAMLGICPADLEPANLWISLLNPQGFDEVGLVIGARNYSVVAAIISGLRALTMANVYAEGDEGLADEFLLSGVRSDKSETFRRQQQVHADPKGLNIPQCIQSLISSNHLAKKRPGLSRNHLFMSAYSTLGVSHGYLHSIAGQATDPTRLVSGFAHVTTDFQLHPGHEKTVSDALERLLESTEQPKTIGSSADISVLEMGSNDFSCTLGSAEYNEILQPRGISTDAFLGLTAEFLAARENLSELQGGEVGIRRATCVLTVPFPRLAASNIPWLLDTPPVTAEDLPGMSDKDVAATARDQRLQNSQKYFEEHAPLVEALVSLKLRAQSRFDIRKLANALRKSGVPRSLRIAVRYLFQDFFLNLSNPASLDGVLGLYDAFGTLYHVLTEELPKRAKNHVGHDGLDFRVLKELIDAFQNAFTHRVSAVHGFHELHDMAIDWRGGMNQVAEAADSPLKCAQGIVKFWAKTCGRLKHEDGYERIGSVTAVKLTPAALCAHSLFREEGDNDAWHCLSYLHVNVGHVFHPRMFVAYLHEGAHMLRTLVRKGEPDPRQELRDHLAQLRKIAQAGDSLTSQRRAAALSGRHDEQFANLIVFMFVFAEDKDLFLRFSFSQFGVHESPYLDRTLKIKQLIEYAIRLFFVVDPCEHSSQWSKPDSPYSFDIDDLKLRFKELIKSYIPYFSSDHRELMEDKTLMSLADWQIDLALTESWKFAVAEWQQARRIYEAFACDRLAVPWNWCVRPSSQGNDNVEHKQIDRTELQSLRDNIVALIMRCLESGETMVGNTIRRELRAAWDHDLPADQDSEFLLLDETILVCETLRAYVKLAYSTLDQALPLFVPRCEDNRSVRFAGTDEPGPWNALLFDHGFDGLYCVDPKVRQEHLLSQIVVLRKFWDISSAQRGRRLHEMTKWGECE